MQAEVAVEAQNASEIQNENEMGTVPAKRSKTSKEKGSKRKASKEKDGSKRLKSKEKSHWWMAIFDYLLVPWTWWRMGSCTVIRWCYNRITWPWSCNIFAIQVAGEHSLAFFCRLYLNVTKSFVRWVINAIDFDLYHLSLISIVTRNCVNLL